MSLPDELRQRLAAAGLTQAALAKLMGVSRGRVCDWLAGRRGMGRATYLRLVDVCDAAAAARHPRRRQRKS